MSNELAKQETQVPAKTETAYRRPFYRVESSKKHHTVEVFMPGVAKDDYSVTLQHDELLVEGKKVIPLPTGAQWLHREITPESYKLRLQLNVEVDSEGITAKSENGILRITLPVAKAALPRPIKIQ